MTEGRSPIHGFRDMAAYSTRFGKIRFSGFGQASICGKDAGAQSRADLMCGIAMLTLLLAVGSSSTGVELAKPSGRAIDDQTPGVTERVPFSIFRSKLTEIAAACANSVWVMRRSLRAAAIRSPLPRSLPVDMPNPFSTAPPASGLAVR
jgi:hypothetical protein